MAQQLPVPMRCATAPFLFVAAVTAVAATADPWQLRDPPIAAHASRSLDTADGQQWTASPASTTASGVDGLTINASVPGDLITDLEDAGLVGDPWFETNWRNATLWDQPWRFSTQFTLSEEEAALLLASTDAAAAAEAMLIFEGIKMGATVTLDGKSLGTATDQWLRYTWPVKLGAGPHELTVSFDRSIDTHGRYMGCSGGWDWAPMSTTVTPERSPTFSYGIWKSVYLVFVSSTSIAHVAPRVFTESGFSTTDFHFTVETAVHFDTPGDTAVKGTLKVEGEWGATTSETVTLQPGPSTAVLNVSATSAQVKLWWPVRMGEQNLYNISVQFAPEGGEGSSSSSSAPPPISASRRIGFRDFKVITAAPGDDEEANGSGNYTMRYQVNGQAVFSRGANVVPMEELEGRASALALRTMLESAAEGGMNTLRIWGGGLFFYGAFYEAADELGLMILHDLMFIEQGHGPCCPFYGAHSGWSNAGHAYNVSCECVGEAAATQHAELQHQMRRLAPHPSIVIWDACNECGGFGLYSDFVMTTVAQEDRSRVVLPSCPSNGWLSGVFRGSGLPNGQKLVNSPGKTNDTRPCTACQCGLSGCSEAESHGPYLGGSGFVTDEKGPGWNATTPERLVPIKLFEPKTPPILSISQTGVDKPGTFTSEFGAVTMSSFESMSATLKPEHWSLHSPPFRERNWPADGIIASFFGNSSRAALDKVGALPLQRQAYQSMLGQALVIKSQVETFRATNIWGTLTWQLNDVYPSGSWGSLEYGPEGRAGQVVGGRWKVLHYVLRQTAFADILPACSVDGSCYIKNDAPTAWTGQVNVSIMQLSTGHVQTINTKAVSLAPGAGVLQAFCVHANDGDGGGACRSLREALPQCYTTPASEDLAAAAGSPVAMATCVLIVDAVSASGEMITHNVVALAPPKGMELPKNVSVGAKVTSTQEGTVEVSLEAKGGGVALYVVMTTSLAGRFSDNAIVLAPDTPVSVTFLPFGELAEKPAADLATELAGELRVEHLAQHCC